MRLSITFCCILLNIVFFSTAKKLKDEDFSEFDNFDDENPLPQDANHPSNKIEPIKTESAKVDDVTVDEENDDDTMFDDEEFENLDSISSSSASTSDLKFTEVPSNLTGNRWEAYCCEGVMIIVVLGYLINFLVGRAKNARLASAIYRSQYDLLEKNFSLIGDDNEQTTHLQKESEYLYILWCTGRVAIESMLMEIRLIKRQCLFNSLAALIKSINDTIVYTIDFSKDDLETFVFCLAKKRSAIRLHRDMNDLSQFCAERKNADKRGLLSGNYQILSEFGEVTSTIIDNRLVDFIDKYPDAIESIHISDQYTGSKNQTENPQSNTNSAPQQQQQQQQQQDAVNPTERSVRRVLIVTFNLLAQKDRSLQVTSEYIANDYLRLVFHLIDRLSSYRFQSKETKLKATKNRQRIEEQFLKNVYQQRQEQAQQRREEKRRAEKEKMMQLDDPERQRKWEEKEHKRELKRRQPKMKQMKVKSM